MSTVGHFLEEQGIATVSVSLVREHSVQMKPPRALWVPFVLGRPFGVPNDPEFQADVLRAALALLERSDGPVILEDYPHDAPATTSEQMEAMFCPVAFASRRGATADTRDSVEAVLVEMQALTPWYEQSLTRNGGRSTVGVSGMSVADAVRWLDRFRRGEAVEPAAGNNLAQTLRFACEDLRAWYSEAAIAQPGANPEPAAMADWYWGETAVSHLLLKVQTVAAGHDDAQVKLIGKVSMVPRSQQHRLL